MTQLAQQKKTPSDNTSTLGLAKPSHSGTNQGLSKSIIVNQNRKQIIQSLGRYNDIMSHENFEQEFETVNLEESAHHKAGLRDLQGKEQVIDLYHLGDSYDSMVPQ